VPGLLNWRERRLREADADDWTYRQSWLPVDGLRQGPLAGRWLVVVPSGDDPWITGVVEALGPDAAVIELDNIDLDSVDAEPLVGADCAGVVWLPPTDKAGVAATLRLIQALRESGSTAPLWVLTRAAVTARPGEQVAGIWQGGIWGLGRVAALELP